MDTTQVKARLRSVLQACSPSGGRDLPETDRLLRDTLTYIEILEGQLDTPIGRRLQAMEQRLDKIEQRLGTSDQAR